MFDKLIIPTKEEVIDLCKKMGAGRGHSPVYLNILASAIKKYNNCKTIVEIGVDKGESAFAMFKAIPNAKYYGYDFWGFRKWLLDYPYHKDMAEKLLQYFDTTLTQINSKDLTKIPYADLIHVDGDHSFEGCLADLNLVYKFLNPKGVILVHDMSHVAVTNAVVFWHKQHKEFQIEIFEFSTHWAIIWRRKEK